MEEVPEMALAVVRAAIAVLLLAEYSRATSIYWSLILGICGLTIALTLATATLTAKQTAQFELRAGSRGFALLDSDDRVVWLALAVQRIKPDDYRWP